MKHKTQIIIGAAAAWPGIAELAAQGQVSSTLFGLAMLCGLALATVSAVAAAGEFIVGRITGQRGRVSIPQYLQENPWPTAKGK